jgi:hypothetical protein
VRLDPVAQLHKAADGVQEGIEALMYVRSTTKQRRAADRLWWELMTRAAEELTAKADRVLGDDRRY